MKTLIEYCKEKFEFQHFSNSNLVYKASDGFLVRIPVEDLDGAFIEASEKGSVLMKWIRKELNDIKSFYK